MLKNVGIHLLKYFNYFLYVFQELHVKEKKQMSVFFNETLPLYYIKIEINLTIVLYFFS